MVGKRRFGKKKRVDAPCDPAEEKPACLFPTLMADIVDTGIVKGDNQYILKIVGIHAAGCRCRHDLLHFSQQGSAS
ncbi:hypothetical protein AM501_11895 [Aneurinibacillus migulanus]|uniref:hypothetical protein n=1 Tax=Aneurinibacillus migulanus TaxID=47500 RepID=UPI0005BBC17C|nr:hypothetical protein [Aneurinibacillus migulanus]KIV54553.1 hypothetical protein TS64_16155 [Aneurinibacillus migulanus]KPD08051.1 hypothetical protein AM501_11895 [Aneurinibacillus migulanus]